MVNPKFMIDIEKNIIDPEYCHIRSRKKYMVEPKKKFGIDQEKTAWLILKKSMQIQPGTICNPRLCHSFHHPSHFTRASKMVNMNSPPPPPGCVLITYHMLPPFVYEGPAVAVLY